MLLNNDAFFTNLVGKVGVIMEGEGMYKQDTL